MKRARELVVVGLLLVSMAADAGITTPTVIARTVAGAPGCASWRVSGACFWLTCSWHGCHVSSSVRVSHYIPDVVVSTYHDPATHPWSDYGMALATSATSVGSGLLGMLIDSAGTRTRDNERRDRNKMFRDADAIGNPVVASPGLLGMSCPSAATAFYPYDQSFLDALVWREIIPIESLYPQSLVPGVREIGSWPTNTWGNLYPRVGSVTQEHFVKGAAVLSQRVGDIITRTGQPHVYTPLPTGGVRMMGSYRVWLPPPLVEMDASTGKWQMISPAADTTCGVFGVNDTFSVTSWGDNKTDPNEGYSFNLWRPYSCCQRAGTWFLYAVTW